MRAILSVEVMVCCGLGLVLPVRAEAQVRATLVAADTSVRPGASMTLALRLDHEPTWHTYWKTPGTGLPTSIRWELPQGWSAGEIEWPVPGLITNAAGEITGHGYTGVTYLPVTVSAPKTSVAGKAVTLLAHVSWLMCARECIPKKADLSIELPVSSELPHPNSAVRAGLVSIAMPEELPKSWNLTATRAGQGIQVTVMGNLSAPHFFSEEDWIQFDVPQKIAATPVHLTLLLTVAQSSTQGHSRLLGVLAYTDAAGAYRGVRVDVPIAAAAGTP